MWSEVLEPEPFLPCLADLRPSYRIADISEANHQERDSPQEVPANTRNQSKDLQSRNAAVAGVLSQALGLIAGAYLWRYRVAAFVGLKGLGNALVKWVAWLITWLMGAPAGLKLHEELSGLLGHAALWALHSSAAVYSASAAFLLVPLLGDIYHPFVSFAFAHLEIFVSWGGYMPCCSSLFVSKVIGYGKS